jgi:hypothetical protein
LRLYLNARRFIVPFLACASGFGSLNLLFAASRVLRLGMSSSSTRSHADWVSRVVAGIREWVAT